MISSIESRPTSSSEPAAPPGNGRRALLAEEALGSRAHCPSDPPTFTIATPSSDVLMLCRREPTEMAIWRDDRSSTAAFCTTGQTTRAHHHDLCPDSRWMWPVWVEHRLALAAGDDDRLVGPGGVMWLTTVSTPRR